MAQKRHWCVTDWPTEDNDDIPTFNDADMKYLIVGRETCPDTGKQHFQCYVQFRKSIRLTTAKKYFSDKAHLEPAMGTPEQASEYCKKEGNFSEFGELDKPGKRNDLLAAKTFIDSGATSVQVASEYFAVAARHYKFFDYYKQLKLPTDRTVFDKSYCTILWGDPGSGKSRTAYACDSYQVLQYDPRSRFWSAAWDGSKRIIVDDVCPATFSPRELWLNILDPFAKQLSINIKGGYSKFAPVELVLTSNYDPTTWMPGDAAFTRRLDEFCTIRHMVGFVDVAMRRFFEPATAPLVERDRDDREHESDSDDAVSWASSEDGEPHDDGASEYSQQVRFAACDRANATAGEYVGPSTPKRCRYAEEAAEDNELDVGSDTENALLEACEDY